MFPISGDVVGRESLVVEFPTNVIDSDSSSESVGLALFCATRINIRL